jgi:hypothetical protein
MKRSSQHRSRETAIRGPEFHPLHLVHFARTKVRVPFLGSLGVPWGVHLFSKGS